METKQDHVKAAEVFRFAKAMPDSGFTDLSGDPMLSLMAVCVAQQQKAGFRTLIDIRRCDCPTCGSAGFNDGMGALRFVCGAEIVGEDFSVPCPSDQS